MYNDIGKKIQRIAQILGWTLLTVGCLAWLILLTNGYTYYGTYYQETSDDIWGWVSLMIGALGFVSSWVIYGFGQLVDDVHVMRGRFEEPAEQNDQLLKL